MARKRYVAEEIIGKLREARAGGIGRAGGAPPRRGRAHVLPLAAGVECLNRERFDTLLRSSSKAGGGSTTRSAPTAPWATVPPPPKRSRSDRPIPPPWADGRVPALT